MTGVVSINDEVVCLLNYRFVAITADVPHGYLGALDICAAHTAAEIVGPSGQLVALVKRKTK